MNLQNLYNKALDKLVNKDEVIDEFMKLLEQKVEEARQTLFERFEWQCSQSDKSAKFMYENNTMYGYIPEEGIKSALKHGTTVIGQLGLAETLNILIGEDQTHTLQIDSLNKGEIEKNMISYFEKSESRELTDEEKKQIKKFVDEQIQ